MGLYVKQLQLVPLKEPALCRKGKISTLFTVKYGVVLTNIISGANCWQRHIENDILKKSSTWRVPAKLQPVHCNCSASSEAPWCTAAACTPPSMVESTMLTVVSSPLANKLRPCASWLGFVTVNDDSASATWAPSTTTKHVSRKRTFWKVTEQPFPRHTTSPPACNSICWMEEDSVCGIAHMYVWLCEFPRNREMHHAWGAFFT